jgi:hypothetical protein
MDASDRIRRAQQKSVAVSNIPTFRATWTSASTTLTYVSGTRPIVGSFVNSTGIPSNTVIVSVSGTSVTVSNSTTAAQTSQTVAMTPRSSSLTSYDSYDTKYMSQAGLSYLSYDSGVPTYASTLGAFGCEGSP